MQYTTLVMDEIRIAKRASESEKKAIMRGDLRRHINDRPIPVNQMMSPRVEGSQHMMSTNSERKKPMISITLSNKGFDLYCRLFSRICLINLVIVPSSMMFICSF